MTWHRLNSRVPTLLCAVIKQRQQKREDQAAAALELESEENGGDLQDRLKNAGIVDSDSSGMSVLERLKKQKEKA